MTATATPQATVSLADLPPLNSPLAGGTFAGLITQPDGMHVAVVLLPGQGSGLTRAKAGAWAKKLGGVLPTRPIAALLFANAKALLRPAWHWTSEANGASYAWLCSFNLGHQYYDHKSFAGSAVAVRCIPLSA